MTGWHIKNIAGLGAVGVWHAVCIQYGRNTDHVANEERDETARDGQGEVSVLWDVSASLPDWITQEVVQTTSHSRSYGKGKGMSYQTLSIDERIDRIRASLLRHYCRACQVWHVKRSRLCVQRQRQAMKDTTRRMN